MERRRVLALSLLAFAILLLISIPIWLFTPLSTALLGPDPNDPNGPPLTPITYRPMPRAVPQAVLIPRGAPNAILASEAILLDARTGTLLYEKNGENPLPMASTTKIMTALIALQSGKLDQMVTVGEDAVAQDRIGSTAHLRAGEQLTLKELLYGLLLPSGDDAAVAIADGVAGSQEAFVHIMNVEAQRLHLFQTHFYDPTGLDTDLDLNPIPSDQHYTTPYDLVRLARYAMNVPLFAQIVSLSTYALPATATHGPFKWDNTNTLLKSYQGALGVKTGWTGAARGCLVFAAKRGERALIGVVLHSGEPGSNQNQDEVFRTTDATTLLNWGFGLPLQVPRV